MENGSRGIGLDGRQQLPAVIPGVVESIPGVNVAPVRDSTFLVVCVYVVRVVKDPIVATDRRIDRQPIPRLVVTARFRLDRLQLIDVNINRTDGPELTARGVVKLDLVVENLRVIAFKEFLARGLQTAIGVVCVDVVGNQDAALAEVWEFLQATIVRIHVVCIADWSRIVDGGESLDFCRPAIGVVSNRQWFVVRLGTRPNRRREYVLRYTVDSVELVDSIAVSKNVGRPSANLPQIAGTNAGRVIAGRQPRNRQVES